MKILHVIDSGGLYGAEIMLLSLMEEQQKLGLKIAMASIGDRNVGHKPIETEARRKGHHVVTFRMMPGPNVAGALKILRFARNEEFDLIHSHGYKPNILFGFIPRWIRKIPLISTLHGWTSTSGFSKMKIYEWLDAKSLRYIDAVVLVNKAMLFNEKLKRQKQLRYNIINNGIPIRALRHEVQDQGIKDFCKDKLIIGSIGRLSAEKGYEDLIEAFSHLVKERLDIRLLIIGEGRERQYLEQLIQRKNLKDLVCMPGYKFNASHYLQYFSVYTISSLTEGLPITLLEAMQARVPVVATQVGGIPDVLDHGKVGLLVRPRDPRSLAGAIRRVLMNKHVGDGLTDVSYDRFTAYYSSEIMSKKYLELYRKLHKQPG